MIGKKKKRSPLIILCRKIKERVEKELSPFFAVFFFDPDKSKKSNANEFIDQTKEGGRYGLQNPAKISLFFVRERWGTCW